MASGPSQQEKAKVREQIERLLNDLFQHFPEILKKAKDGAAAAGGQGQVAPDLLPLFTLPASMACRPLG